MNKELLQILSVLVILGLVASVAYAFLYESQTKNLTQTIIRKWLSGWDKRVKITIDPTDVDAPLSDFPVLIHISSSSGANSDDVTFIFDELQSDANRKKIAVTTSDKVTQCYVEIESWNTTSKQTWLWVKTPNVNDTVDTVLYLYYDRDHADNTNYVGDPNSTPAENVWDSNLVFVSHMQDDPDTSHIRDSTQNNNDGTKTGATGGPAFTTSGYVDGAQSFLDETNDTVECNDNASLDITDAITIEAWVKPTISALREMFMKGLYYSNEAYEFYQNGPKVNWRLNNNAISKTSTNSLTINAWNHIAVTYDKNLAYNNMKIFIAGAQDPTTGNYTTAILTNDFPFVIGAYPQVYTGYRYPFEGYIDEVRISNVARSAAWIRASYESGRDNFLYFGNEETRWLSGWDKRVKITIDPTNIDAPLYDFPVLIYLSSSSGANNDDVTFIFDELQNDSNRKKIAVTTDNKINQCYVEIERWNTTSEQAWLWVKVPLINNTVNTELYLYFDKGQLDNTNYVGDTDSTPAGNVWNSDYVLVWHLGEEGDAIDSTSNNNNGTVIGLTSVAGKVGYARNSSGGSNGIASANTITLGTGQFTVEGWFNPNVYTADWIGLFGPKDPTIDYNEIMWPYQGKWGYWDWDLELTSNQPIVAGQWDYYVVVREGTGSDQLKNYINGLYDNAGTSTRSFPAQPVWLGKSSTYPWNGISDELRISNVSRSVAWIRASYESGRDNFLDFNSEEIA